MSATFEKKFLDDMKKALLDEEVRLSHELSQFAKKNEHAVDDFNAEFPELGDKDDENAAEVAIYSDNLTLEQELESALRDVRGALKRFNEDTYGICKYCKKPIDERRLRARPASSSCVECKKLLTQEV